MTGRVREDSGLTRAPGSGRRFVGALAAFVVVAVGIPVGLIAVARLTLSSWHPVPGVGPLDEIRTWLSRELSSSEIVPILLRVLLAAAWLLWLGLLGSVLSSIATSRPSLEHLRLPRLTMFDGLGGWIAAGLTALSSLTPRVADATPAVPTAQIEVSEAAGARPLQPAQPRPIIARAGWAMVEHGESIEMFAARTLGDGSRWPEVWAINHGRVMDEVGTTWSEVWRLGVGWQLELPAARPARTSEPQAALHLVDLVDQPGALDAPHRNGDALIEVPVAPAGQYVVDAGDSYWRIAEVTLRAELQRQPTGAEVLVRTHELIAINAARLGDADDPHMLHPGDVVYLATPSLADADPVASAGEYVVDDGDSYWRIAEVTLRAELGREPSTGEVLARMHELMAINAARLGDVDDPHMLHPGDIVHLPLARADAAPLVDQPAPAPPADQTPPPAPSPPTSPVTPPEATAPPPVTPEPSGTTAGRLGPPPPRPTSPPPVEPATPPPSSVPAPSERAHGDAGTPSGVLAGMSAVALAGVAGGWAWRRQRAAQRARPHQRPAPVSALEREVAGRDVSDVTWMAAELRLLAHRLPPATRAELTVQLVQVGAAGLEVAFAEVPATAPPDGWRQAAERVWQLDEHHASDDLATVADAPPVVPALVTLGDQSEGQLLFNLEAVAGVNVAGDDALVWAWLTGVAWEIAGAALSERPTVILVDVDVPGADQLAGVTRMSAAEAAAAIHADRGDDDIATLHRRVGEWEAWPPTIVIIAGSSIDDGWAELASLPSVAVIAVHGRLPGGLDVTLAGGQLSIPAWGLQVPATVLAAATAAAGVEVLAAADAAPVADDLTVAVPTADTPLDVAVDDDWEPPTFPVTVHLLGEPFATRHGERLALSPQLLSALAYLAVHRDVSVDDFREALWAGEDMPRQRIGDVLTDLRKPIGGRAVVGYIEDGRIRVGAELGTDLDVFNALNSRAQEAPGELTGRMHEIMYLVRGRPFSFSSTAAGMWRWVDHPDSLEALWGLRVSTVGWELAGLYLERGDPGTARDIAERGLIADPLNAALTERLMEAYAALNAVEAAQRVYESHDRALTARGYDGASEETRRVLERLRAAHAGTADVAVGS